MKRKNVIINEKKQNYSVAVADTYFLRLRGLIGRNAAEIGGLLIKPCNQIHTFFMKEEIDVVYLTKEGKVLEIDPSVPVKKFCRAVHGARKVLELPAGKAKELNISETDVLEFQI